MGVDEKKVKLRPFYSSKLSWINYPNLQWMFIFNISLYFFICLLSRALRSLFWDPQRAHPEIILKSTENNNITYVVTIVCVFMCMRSWNTERGYSFPCITLRTCGVFLCDPFFRPGNSCGTSSYWVHVLIFIILAPTLWIPYRINCRGVFIQRKTHFVHIQPWNMSLRSNK